MSPNRVVVIGAGIIGCAIARAIARRFPRLDVTVLEAQDAPGAVTSSNNSGVIHSGMHVRPDFLKGRFALQGSRDVVAYCRNAGVPIEQRGMIVAATRSDLIRLATRAVGFSRILSRGFRQGISMRILDAKRVAALEPSLRTIGGLFVPSVCIIDQRAFCRQVAADAALSGVAFRFNAKVTDIAATGQTYQLTTTAGEFRADILVNAAGLHAHEISAMAGGPAYAIEPYRGEYYEVVDPVLRQSIRHLVYPVKNPREAGLGIHLTPTVDGRLLIGPNSRRVRSVEAFEEDPTPVETFRREVERFWPPVRTAELRWAYAGIRPKIGKAGTENDFIIQIDQTSPMLINTIGIESPGLTAALPIGDYVASLLENSTP